nr:uncharacterized protein LOC112292650 isoform X2 [Physcomitrium patens]|eukprot:XP_024397114.1 uncharacterized protein LOC112292650 isoform X2 [Physcomitrella patens]
MASDSREVVVPAIEGRVEVYIDRKGSQEVVEALELGTGHTGLGYVDQESGGCTNHTFVKESGNVIYSELNCVEDKNVAGLEAMQVDTEEDDYLHLKTPNHLKSSVSTSKTKKNRRGGSSVEKASKKGINGGYISIGGLKVFTEAGVTYSDESVDLEKDSDVSLELSFSSGKKRRSKGGKKDKKKFRQRGEWLDNSFSESGESIIDSSDSDLDDDLVEDYIANLEGAGESVDASWILKNKMKQVAVEDMGRQDDEDEDEDDDDDDDDDSSSAGASGSDDGSSESGSTSAERMWRLKWQSKGKELMDTDVDDDGDDDELDSGLDDISKEIVFGGSGGKRGRKTQTALLLGKLVLEDSEEDSHDGEGFDQLIDLMEDEKFMPDYVNKTLEKSKQKKKNVKKSNGPVTWPIQVHQSKTKSKSIPGDKKRERKKMIAAKRQERALRRGLDLQAINSALEDIVLRGTDIYAFGPMENRDRAQIHKMAAIYRLKSGSQGTGSKRFTVVTRTKHTKLPTGADKYRIASMLDQADENLKRSLTGEARRMDKKAKKAARDAFISFNTPNPKKSGKKHQKFMQASKSMEKSGRQKLRAPKYASNPMSFISCGTIGNEEESLILEAGPSECVTTTVQTSSMTQGGEATTSRSSTVVKVSSTVPATIGHFEAHTKGFGSRMMSKMGFVEGQGLGRDGQGIYSPLEAVKRPKSLGLGAYAPSTPS